MWVPISIKANVFNFLFQSYFEKTLGWCCHLAGDEVERLSTPSGYPLLIKASLTCSSTSVLSLVNVHKRFAVRCNVQQPYGQWGGRIGSQNTCQYVLLSCRLWWIGSHWDCGWFLCQGNRVCRSSLTQRVNWIDGSTELRWAWKAWTCSGGSAMQVSSTYLFQKGGGSGYVETTFWSTSSVTRSASITDTGDPMAVPKDCW